MAAHIATVARQEWRGRGTFQARFVLIEDVPVSELDLTVRELLALYRLTQSSSPYLLHGVEPGDSEILERLVKRARARRVKLPRFMLFRSWWRRLVGR